VSRFKLFRLKNQMFFFNLIAIAIGVLSLFILSYHSISPPTPEIERLTFRIALYFEPLCFLFVLVATLLFEQPIRRYLDFLYRQEAIPQEIASKARQRLLNETWQYEEKQKLGLTKGQIIVFGTDGIWEAHNAKGDIFGKEALFEIIRQYAESSSKQIVAAIIDALNRFRQDVIPEDDVTLVVVKVVN